MSNRRSLEQGTKESSGVPELFDDVAGHLKDKDTAFFLKWFRLVDIEFHFSLSQQPARDVWTDTVEQR